MPLTQDQAHALLTEWTDNPSLLTHARCVELAMRQCAQRLGLPAEVQTAWGITGLLHDADYDRWPDEHPRRIIAWLEAQGESEMAHAVLCHFDLDTEPQSDMARAIVACDELAGFIVACCLVRPDGIHNLAPSSVKKKLKDRAFAAKVDRSVIERGVERLGVTLDDQIRLIVQALEPHAQELGIGGKNAAI